MIPPPGYSMGLNSGMPATRPVLSAAAQAVASLSAAPLPRPTLGGPAGSAGVNVPPAMTPPPAAPSPNMVPPPGAPPPSAAMSTALVPVVPQQLALAKAPEPPKPVNSADNLIDFLMNE